MVPPLAGPVSEGRKRWNHPSSSDIIFKVNTALPVFALVFSTSLLLRLPLKVVLLGIVVGVVIGVEGAKSLVFVVIRSHSQLVFFNEGESTSPL